jgi:hypothetical protein
VVGFFGVHQSSELQAPDELKADARISAGNHFSRAAASYFALIQLVGGSHFRIGDEIGRQNAPLGRCV